jgi:hypothetical protein
VQSSSEGQGQPLVAPRPMSMVLLPASWAETELGQALIGDLDCGS